MGIKQQIQYSAQINDDYLTEGIRFFKNSKRIEKLIKKFQDSIVLTRDPETKQEVSDYIKELQKAKLDFESVEQKYAIGNKEEAKEEYKNLRVKFAEIMTQINKESLKKFMIVAGLATLAFAVFGSIVPSRSPIVNQSANAYSLTPAHNSLTMDEKSLQQQIDANNRLIRTMKDRIKAMKLFDHNQELLKKLAEEQLKLQGKING